MTDPVNLAAEKARRTGDCRDWSPLDALKETVREIESGERDFDMIYICARLKTDDGMAEYTWRAAGMTHLESLGLLYKHLQWTEREAREDDA